MRDRAQLARRILRWLSALVLAVLLVLALLLGTGPGLRLVLAVGLPLYDDRIAGAITVEHAEGRLLGRFVLRGVTLADRSGRPLVRADAIAVDWSPLALVRGHLRVRELRLDGARVHLLSDDAGSFADLAPPGEDVPEDLSEPPGPNLPLAIAVDLRLRDAAVFAGDGAPLVESLDLDAQARGADRAARLDITSARARLVGAHDLHALRLHARWAAPVATIEHLRVRLPAAELIVPHAQLDVRRLAGELRLHADATLAGLAALLPPNTLDSLRPLGPRLVLTARAEGVPEDMSAGLRLTLDPGADLTLTARGAWQGERHADLRLAADVDLAPWTGGQIRHITPTLDLRANALTDDRLALVGALRCQDCPGLGPLALEFDGLADPARKDLSIETSLNLAGISALADARLAGGVLHALRWRLSIPELARPLALARRFAPAAPAVTGSLAGHGRCDGPALRCHAALDLRRLALADLALGSARLDLHVSEDMSAGTLAITARELRYDSHRLDDAALSLAVATTGSGSVAPFIPGDLPPLRADLQASATTHTGDQARIDLSLVTGDALAVQLRDFELTRSGQPPLRLGLVEPAELTLRARSFTVDHLHLDAAGGSLALRGVADLDGTSDIRLDLADFPLAALTPLVPDLRPAGRASAALRLRGPPDRPEARVDLALRSAGLRRRPLGDLDLSAHLADAQATLDLDLRGPLARRLAVRADLPLRLDLSDRSWSFGHTFARVKLTTRDLRLRNIAPFLGDTPLAGRMSGDLALEGNFAAAPRLAGDWYGRGLAVGGVPVGDLDLVVRQRADWLRTQLELRRAGGRARLDAHVPLALDLADLAVRWRRERDHHAELRIDDLDLAAQLAALAPDLDLDGRVHARLDLSGPATAPVLTAELRARDLRHGDLSFGSYGLDLVTRDGGTSLELRGDGPVGHLHLQALAPLALDHRGPRWRRDGWYALDLDLRDFDLAAVQPVTGVAVDGRVRAHLALDGPGARPRLQGSLGLDDLTYAGESVGDLSADFNLHEGTAALAARGRLGRRGRLRLDACVPLALDLRAPELAWSSGQCGEFQLALTGIDRTALAPVHTLPPDARLDLDLRAHAVLDPEARVRGRLAVDGAVGRTDAGTAPLKLRLDIDDARQKLRLALGDRDSDGRLDLALDADASLPALRRGDAELRTTALRGRLRARAADLSPLSGLLPTALHDLEGLLYADLELGGRLDRLAGHGRLFLRHGAITVVPLQQRFQAITADLALDGARLRVDRLHARSGEGRVRATGHAALTAAGIDAAADLTLRRFPVVKPGWPQITVDTQIKASVDSRPDRLAVALTIPGAEVYVSDLTTRAPDPLPENDNVTIAASPQLADLVADDAPPPDAQYAPKDMSFKIALTRPVHIQGPTMDMRWAGAITSISAGDDTEVTGQFSADRGRFELLGNDFRIEQGRVFLPEDGPSIDPFLDLVADARTGQYDVSVSLRGRLSRPTLKLRSRPALTEPQIFALLLTGTVDSNEADPKRAQASAAGLLVNFTSPTLSRFADQRLGIDRIKFGFGADLTQPILTVGKYLSRSIYAETTYHHNAPPRRNRIQGQVEYRFAPEWSVETFFGDAAVGGLDVFWRRRFGGRKPRRTLPRDSLIGGAP